MGKPIPYRIGPRRAGDATIVYADPSLAKERIGWQAELDVDAMCVDHWRWQQQNPHRLLLVAGRRHPLAVPNGRGPVLLGGVNHG